MLLLRRPPTVEGGFMRVFSHRSLRHVTLWGLTRAQRTLNQSGEVNPRSSSYRIGELSLGLDGGVTTMICSEQVVKPNWATDGFSQINKEVPSSVGGADSKNNQCNDDVTSVPRKLVSPARLLLRHASLIGALFKWRLSGWVTFSAIPGYIMSLGYKATETTAGLQYPETSLLWGIASVDLTALCVGVFLCSGGANAFNQILERASDAQMIRTRLRPLASGRASVPYGLLVATGATSLGLATLWAGVNGVTAGLAATTTVLYTCVYTPLKRRTPYNTHVGAIAGSIPTLMGCSANQAPLTCWDPWMLFAIQTLWQFPHFYGLAWRYRLDYARGGFVSFPLSDVHGHGTAAMMKPYLATTWLLPLATTFGLQITSPMFLLDGTFLNILLWSAFRSFEANPCVKTWKVFFVVSLWHLLGLLSLAVFHGRWTRKADTIENTDAECEKRRVPYGLCWLTSLRSTLSKWCWHETQLPLLERDAVCLYKKIKGHWSD